MLGLWGGNTFLECDILPLQNAKDTMHHKKLRAESWEAESSAVHFSRGKSWSVPSLNIVGDEVVSEVCLELFTFLQTVDSYSDACKLIECCFRLMGNLHASGALHLDFHPKNIVLSENVKEGAATVAVQGTVFAMYCIDLETLWHPSCNALAFNVVGEAWNDCRAGGMGRLPHSAYTVDMCYCFDVYTFSTYVIKFVQNRYVQLLKSMLHGICGLDAEAPLPGVVTETNGHFQKYYTYLLEPDGAVLRPAAASALCRMLLEVVDTLAVEYEHGKV